VRVGERQEGRSTKRVRRLSSSQYFQDRRESSKMKISQACGWWGRRKVRGQDRYEGRGWVEGYLGKEDWSLAADHLRRRRR
jgi:hypothetical protein